VVHPIDKLVRKCQKLLREGHFQDAVQHLDQALNSLPHMGQLWQLKGTALYAVEQYERAQQALETATLLGPLSFEAQLTLADCYLRAESFPAADCIYEHLAANANRLPARLLPLLAARLGVRGKFPQALHVCRRAAELQPDCDQAAFGLAYYMTKVGCPPRRILPVIRKAFELSPDCLAYRLALAHIMHRCGDARGAYRLVRKLEMDDIAHVTCRCCVRRLMQIYALAEDYRRCDWCRARMQVLDQEAC